MKVYVLQNDYDFGNGERGVEVIGVYESLELAKEKMNLLFVERKLECENSIYDKDYEIDTYGEKDFNDKVNENVLFVCGVCVHSNECCCDYWYDEFDIYETEIIKEEKTIAENTVEFILDNFYNLTGVDESDVESLTSEMIESIKNHGVLCDNEIIENVNYNLAYNTKLLKFLDDKLTENEHENLKNELYKNYGTDKKCPKCNSTLVKSDLKSYKYLCLECNENFYGIEV